MGRARRKWKSVRPSPPLPSSNNAALHCKSSRAAITQCSLTFFSSPSSFSRLLHAREKSSKTIIHPFHGPWCYALPSPRGLEYERKRYSEYERENSGTGHAMCTFSLVIALGSFISSVSLLSHGSLHQCGTRYGTLFHNEDLGSPSRFLRAIFLLPLGRSSSCTLLPLTESGMYAK